MYDIFFFTNQHMRNIDLKTNHNFRFEMHILRIDNTILKYLELTLEHAEHVQGKS